MRLVGNMNSIRDWLAWYVARGPSLSADRYAYRSVEDFVLRHGQSYKAQSLPVAYPIGFPKACYENSAKLASYHDLAYVEGFALTKGGVQPTHHAWCIDGDNRVIDTTWRESGEEYFGVVLPLAVVLPVMFADKRGKGVLDDWPSQWPMLRKPFERSAHSPERGR
jgi:hypothetical protein